VGISPVLIHGYPTGTIGTLARSRLRFQVQLRWPGIDTGPGSDPSDRIAPRHPRAFLSRITGPAAPRVHFLLPPEPPCCMAMVSSSRQVLPVHTRVPEVAGSHGFCMSQPRSGTSQHRFVEQVAIMSYRRRPQGPWAGHEMIQIQVATARASNRPTIPAVRVASDMLEGPSGICDVPIYMYWTNLPYCMAELT
jgi:hypothetical protein